MSVTNVRIRHYNTIKAMVVVLSILLVINFVGDIRFREYQVKINELQSEINIMVAEKFKNYDNFHKTLIDVLADLIDRIFSKSEQA